MEFNRVQKVLTDFVELMRDGYKERLASEGINASGSLSNSVTANVEMDGAVFEVSLTLNEYWKYIEGGRPPTQNNGNGELRRNILQWIKVKPVLPTPFNGKLPTEEQLAYLISRKIHREGYEGKEPLKKTFEEVEDMLKSDLEIAFAEDIAEDIEKIMVLFK
jgi:hypothetical protein